MPIDPIIQKYIDLIKSKSDRFKAFYIGDPIAIPSSMLPALTVSKRQTITSTFTNAEDQHFVTLVLTVVADIRTTIQDDKTLVPGYATLYDIMEGRDPNTYQLKPDSLLYILRHNVDLDPAHQIATDVSTNTRIDYGVAVNKRQPGSWSIEASLSTVASVVQFR